MRKKAKRIYILIILMFLSFIIKAEENSKETFLLNLDAFLNAAEDIVTEINITTYKDNSPVSNKTYTHFKDSQTDQFLLICTNPFSWQGFSYLKRKDRIWTYTPNTRTFFVSAEYDFIEGTVLKIEDFLPKRYSKNYEVHSKLKTKVNHILAIKLVLRAKSGSAPYDRMTLWIDEEYMLLLKEEAYDSESHLHKTIMYSGWREQGGWYQPSKILITDAMQGGITSYVTIKKTTLSRVPEYVFTRSFVEFITQ